MKPILLALVLTSVHSYLRVFAPSSLSSKFQNKYPQGEIPASLGNFGNPLYGRTLTGRLIAEQGNHILGCSRLEPLSDESFSSHIVMLRRGECAFVAKVRHAQDVGAKAVIITNDVDESIESFVMSDNGSAGNLDIPALLISKEDGEAIRSFVGQTRLTDVVLTITFEVNKSRSKDLDLVVFMQSSSLPALKILKEFYSYLNEFPNIRFTPHYLNFECKPCRETGFVSKKNECIAGGRYCAYDADGSGALEGSDTVVEDLRQICVHKAAGKQHKIWFRYIKEYSEKCFQKSDSKCIQNALKTSGVSLSKVKKCMDDSVEGNDLYIDDNSVMREEELWYRRERIPFNPAIIINNLTYRGDFEIDLLLDAVCATYYSEFMPEFCKEKKKHSQGEVKVKSGWLWFIVFGILVVIIGILLIYRLWLARELRRDMKHQVGAAVASYFQLAEMSKT